MASYRIPVLAVAWRLCFPLDDTFLSCHRCISDHLNMAQNVRMERNGEGLTAGTSLCYSGRLEQRHRLVECRRTLRRGQGSPRRLGTS